MTIGASLADLHIAQPKATCAPPNADFVDCRAPDQALGGGYFARGLTYRFVFGQLVQIRFNTAVDGFSFVVAKLKHDFGEPSEVRRDNVKLQANTFAHVGFAWRNGRSTIQLSDPATTTQLAVRITLDADQERLDDPTT